MPFLWRIGRRQEWSTWGGATAAPARTWRSAAARMGQGVAGRSDPLEGDGVPHQVAVAMERAHDEPLEPPSAFRPTVRQAAARHAG